MMAQDGEMFLQGEMRGGEGIVVVVISKSARLGADRLRMPG